MISQFFRKLLLARQASFEEGEIEILKKHFYMQPIFDFMAFQNDSTKKFGNKVLKLLYENGKAAAADIFEHFKKLGIRKSQLIKVWIDWINMYGIAQLEIIFMDEKKLIVKIKSTKSPFAKEYMQRFGKQKEPVDYILAGAMAGFFSKYFGKKVECEEISCIARGEANCQFVVRE